MARFSIDVDVEVIALYEMDEHCEHPECKGQKTPMHMVALVEPADDPEGLPFLLSLCRLHSEQVMNPEGEDDDAENRTH